MNSILTFNSLTATVRADLVWTPQTGWRVEGGALSGLAGAEGRNALDQMSLFLNDTWSLGRLTVTGGVRWDRYNGWLPEQLQLALRILPVTHAGNIWRRTRTPPAPHYVPGRRHDGRRQHVRRRRR